MIFSIASLQLTALLSSPVDFRCSRMLEMENNFSLFLQVSSKLQKYSYSLSYSIGKLYSDILKQKTVYLSFFSIFLQAYDIVLLSLGCVFSKCCHGCEGRKSESEQLAQPGLDLHAAGRRIRVTLINISCQHNYYNALKPHFNYSPITATIRGTTLLTTQPSLCTSELKLQIWGIEPKCWLNNTIIMHYFRFHLNQPILLVLMFPDYINVYYRFQRDTEISVLK